MKHFEVISWDIDYEVYRCRKCGQTFQIKHIWSDIFLTKPKQNINKNPNNRQQ